VVENPPPSQDNLDRQNISTETTEGEDGLIVPHEDTYTVVDVKKDPPKVFDFVQEVATYPGGEEGMYAELRNYISYPEMEKQNQIEGTVFVSFIVEADGAISNVEVLRGVEEGPGFDKVAVGAVQKLKKKFAPAKMNGNSVRYRMRIPIKFTLN
jgi:protein TonB